MSRGIATFAIGAVVVAGLAVVVFAAGRFIAEDTYEHALVAGDADDAVTAKKLFEEACTGGSERACKALREQHELNKNRAQVQAEGVRN